MYCDTSNCVETMIYDVATLCVKMMVCCVAISSLEIMREPECIPDSTVPCFRHAENIFDKSVSTPTLLQPPYLYINLCQVEIMQKY